MSELNDSEFDPSKPFDVIEEDGGSSEFDPNQPFDVVPESQDPQQPEEEAPEDQLTQSIAIASTKNPERSAEAIRLAKKYELSPEFVEKNLELWKQTDEKQSVDPKKMFAATPALAKFLSRPENAAVAKDDVEALSKIEQASKDDGYWSQAIDAMQGTAYKLLSGIAKSPVLGKQSSQELEQEILMGGYSEQDAAKLREIQSQKTPEVFYKNPVTQFLDKKAEENTPYLQKVDFLKEYGNGNIGLATKAWTLQALSSAPQLALMFAAGPASLPLMGISTSAEKMASNLEKGFDYDLAKSNALLTGTAEAGIEAIGGFGSVGFKESVKAAVKQLGKESAKELFSNGLKQMGKQFIGEGSEELATEIAQSLVDYGSGVDEQALDGLLKRSASSFLVGGLAGAGGAGTAYSVESTFVRLRNKTESDNAKQVYESIGNAARESKLNNRMPEKLKEFMDTVTNGTPIQDIFIPVQAFDTYYQSKNISPVQAAQQLGIKDKYEMAKENGTDITMPMSEWAAQTLNTEHYQGLANDIKFNPEGYTPNEISAQVEALRSEVQQEQKAAEEAAGPEQSTLKVRAEIEKQLREAGLDAKQARANAQIASLSLSNLALVQGLDPLEYYKSRNLSINQVQQMAEAETVLNQQGVTPRGVRVQPSKVGNELRLSPLPEVDVRGNIQTVGEQTFFNFAMVKTKEDQLNLTADMIASIEEGAARNGATSAVVSLKKLNFREQSPMADLFRANGYQLETRNGEKFFVKKLEMPRVFNQAEIKELFQSEDGNIRGQIRFGKDGVNIDLLKNADASTFIHEMGHFYIEEMHKIVQAGTVTNEQFKKDYETLWNFVGAKLGEKLTVEQHEKAAEAYETYFMEGKAPSKELETLFTKLRAWILNAYKLLINKRVELTDDVRGVFDRMLIGFEAKAQVDQEMNLTAPFIADAQTLGMTDAQYEKYLQARQEASKAAENEIVSKLMQDYQKTKTKEYQARRDAIEAEVETELNSMPVYKAMAALQKYQTPYGTSLPKELSTNFGSANFKLDKTFMKAKYGDDFQVTMNFPKGLVADNGLAPSELAPLFGFESGEDLVNALMLAEDKQARLKREADLRMQQRFPDLIVSNQLPEEALKAVHNEQRAKVLRMELEYMAKNDLPALKDIIRRIARRVPSNEAVKQLAVETIAKYQTKDIRPVIFKRAEIKYAKEAGKLLAQGDFEGAFEAKRKELLNFELYRAAVEAKDDVKKTLKDFRKKLAKGDEAIAKSRDTNMVNAARALLAEYGIMRSEKTAAEYLESIQKYEPDTYNGLMTLMGPALSSAGDYESVTYDQFVVLKDSVNALWDLSKTNKEIEIDGKKMSLEAVKADLQAKHDEIAAQDKSVKQYQQTMDKWGKAKSFILGARAALTRVEHWADALDVKRGGPHRRYIWNPISEATANYRLRKVEVLTKLESILKANEASFTQDPIVAEEFKSEKYPGGFLFRSKSELIMAILHSGNESNLHKLLVGRGWGTVDESGVVDTSQWNAFFQRVTTDGTITKADMDMVQAIWDLNESLKPDAQKAHKAMYGFYFNEITAKEIETPFGKYRGGYMPAKVDINENEDAAIRNEKDEFENNNKSFMFPTTGRGFTKSRVENYAAPLSLEINLISSHVDSVLRFIHIEPRVKEIARLVTDKEFRSSLSRIDQFVAKDMLVPWLQRAAQQKVALPSDDAIGRAMDSAARFLRRNVGMQIMFGNVTNTLQQFGGWFSAMSLVRPGNVLYATYSYIKSPYSTVDEIMSKSKWMRSTQGSNLFDVTKSVNDIILNPSAFDNVQNFLQKHTYFLQSAAQNIINTISWSAGYNYGIERGMTEADAIIYADSVVRKTQGSMSPEDISRFETGTPTALLFKQFVGYFNMLANLNANELLRIKREMGLKKGAGKAFYLYMTAFMLPSVYAAYVTILMSGKGLDQDDDDEYLDDALKTFFESQFLTATATVPYAGQFLTSAYNRFNDKMYDDRLSLSPVISTLEGVAGTPYQLYRKLADDADNNKKLTGDVLTLLGTFTGLPVAPVRKPINYLTDVSTGEAEPTGPIDFTRGLVTGRTGNEGQ